MYCAAVSVQHSSLFDSKLFSFRIYFYILDSIFSHIYILDLFLILYSDFYFYIQILDLCIVFCFYNSQILPDAG